MNKRHFLKATGITFVASLLASPFLGRNESSANAQEGKSLEEQVADLTKALETLARDHKITDNLCKRNDRQITLLSKSFIGAVVAIAYDDSSDHEIPEGWHLCDGSVIPSDSKYDALRDLIGDRFPDYQGYFLRGFDRGKGRDPGRVWGSEQKSANKKHVHEISKDAKRAPNANSVAKGEVGGVRPVKFTGNTRGTVGALDGGPDYEPDVQHVYDLPIIPHQHECGQDADGAEESRPINKAVNYIIKYA